jgi:hypothetical protein
MIKKLAAVIAQATLLSIAAVMAGCVANGQVPFLFEV